MNTNRTSNLAQFSSKALTLGVITFAGIPSALAQEPAKAPPIHAPDRGDVKTAAPVYAKVESAPVVHAIVADSEPRPNAASLAIRGPAIDHGRVHYASRSGRLGARGASYKAEFAADGATYVPYFGAHATRNVPLDLRVSGVTIAGRAIAFDASVEAVRDGDHVAFDRGSLVEAYDLSPASVEQKFTFASLPRGGELAVRVAYSGAFAASLDEQGILFASELGSVRYGEATVIDAAGTSAAVREELAGDAIVLTVPASFLATAEFPITIDPIVTSFAVDNSAADDFDADIAYEFGSNSYAVVYEEVFSATDHDVFVKRINADGSERFGFSAYADNSSENWSHPRIASNLLAGKFMVVAQAGADGARNIKGVLIDGLGGGLSAPFIVDEGALAGDMINPVVGGDPSMVGPTFFCVAWERALTATDHDILAQLIRPGGGHEGTTILVENSGATVDTHPAISKSDGRVTADDQRWNIVWQHKFSSTDEDIFGARIRWDGGITEAPFTIDGSSVNMTNPTVSAVTDSDLVNQRYLVAYEMGATGGNSHDIGASVMRVNVREAVDNLSAIEGQSQFDQVAPRVDTDGAQFGLVYRENIAVGFSDYDTFVSTVFFAGTAIGVNGAHTTLGGTGGIEDHPAIVARHGAGATSNEYACVWDRQLLPDRDVFGAIFTSPVGGPISAYCFGTVTLCPCGNVGASTNGCANSVTALGARLQGTGAASLASDSLHLSATGMPSTTTCLFFQGTQRTNNGAGTPFGDGLRCASGSIVRLGTKTASGGSASYPVAGDAPVATRGHVLGSGGVRTYQVWYRNAASFCTPSTFNLSNGLQATWVP